jgi:small subunit ribosomal protein S16
MAVHIRLTRAGAKKHPFYRIVVTDHRSPRGGRFLENLGSFDPSGENGQLVVDMDRLAHWRSKGAQTSHTLDRLLKRASRAQPTDTGAAKPGAAAAAAPARSAESGHAA